ncbi:hypothetical protein [Bacillus sp. AFS017336]|uniref:hypothetical protein n=1 Tax=Bacillus sp. AFS017336 TaxID=2033489 RepID=UPI000BF17EB7|nr:hypothetical protein [Bacillus sp. AFS017336]PEL13258.1 hypothetical protein CN601_05220 [Bacillus sp. AFS017336]
MDLSFDKLLEQFDLKKNEHQKNMHKVNKRIDEIESHMEKIKKQLHNFDHQIVNIEKELKTTLSMINENESNSNHHENHERQEHQAHHENQGHHENHEGHEHQVHQEHQEHPEQSEQKENREHHDHNYAHNWAQNLLNNVEEFSASIFESNHKEHDHNEHDHKGHNQNEHDHKEHRDHKEENEHEEANTKNSRVAANRKKYNNQNNDKMDQLTASVIDESQSLYSSADITSLNQKNYTELASSDTHKHVAEHQQYEHENNTTQKTSEQLLETNFSDLSIDDWEDKTTNLSMSEWFEVDPNNER